MRKNKVFILFLFSMLFASFVSAQTKYGVRAGMQRTNIYAYHYTSSSRLGFQLGGYASMPLDEVNKWFFQPELAYINHGEKNEGTGVDEKYYINYIALSFMFKKYLSDYEDAFYIEAGPQVAYAISQVTESNLAIPSWNRYGEQGDEIAKIDVNIGVGAGYSINREIDFGLRFNYGLTDVYPDAVGENEAKTNNSVSIGFGINYTFR